MHKYLKKSSDHYLNYLKTSYLCQSECVHLSRRKSVVNNRLQLACYKSAFNGSGSIRAKFRSNSFLNMMIGKHCCWKQLGYYLQNMFLFVCLFIHAQVTKLPEKIVGKSRLHWHLGEITYLILPVQKKLKRAGKFKFH